MMDEECPQAISTLCEHATTLTLDMPADIHPTLLPVLEDFLSVFSVELGCTNITQHVIDTDNAIPTKVPPHPIQFYYAERVHQQLQEMAQEVSYVLALFLAVPCSLCHQVIWGDQNMC